MKDNELVKRLTWAGLLWGLELAAAAERPEVLVGAAFAGGVVLALLLKRAGRVS